MIGANIIGLIFFFTSSNEKLPRWNALLVAMAFVSTVAWLDLLGNECVAVLESLGTMTGITVSSFLNYSCRLPSNMLYMNIHIQSILHMYQFFHGGTLVFSSFSFFTTKTKTITITKTKIINFFLSGNFRRSFYSRCHGPCMGKFNW